MLFIKACFPIFCLHAKHIHLLPTLSTSRFFLHSTHLEMDIFINTTSFSELIKIFLSKAKKIRTIYRLFDVNFCEFFRKKRKTYSGLIFSHKNSRLVHHHYPAVLKNLFVVFWYLYAILAYLEKPVHIQRNDLRHENDSLNFLVFHKYGFIGILSQEEACHLYSSTRKQTGYNFLVSYMWTHKSCPDSFMGSL